MSNVKSSFSKFRERPRASVRVSDRDLVKTGTLAPDQSLPLLVEPAMDGVNLIDWASGQREVVEEHLSRHGGVLFRGFGIDSPEKLERLIGALSTSPLRYTERSSPRSQVAGNIYTSTDYPPERSIFLHNEQSYNLAFPLRITFCCLVPAERGGATPIADSRRVLAGIDPDVRARFEREGYRYVRNFGDGFGLSWQEAFQTSDPAEVESYCRNHAIEWEWKEDGKRLRTRQLRRTVAVHPRNRQRSWFNHLTFFHVSSLEPDVQASLRAEFQEEDLPNNTYYADGSSIDPDVMEHLREVYDRETVRFPWVRGDVLMLDNMLVAHGREPFTGERRVVTGMSDSVSWDEC